MISDLLASSIVRSIHVLDHGRRDLQILSAEILSGSKRVIFAMHRDDEEAAQNELDRARQALKKAAEIVKRFPRLMHEGFWRAAQEEFSEADLFAQYLDRRAITRVKGVADDPEIFVGALSDLTGELLRRAILLASSGQHRAIQEIFEDVQIAIDLLLQMDLTGSLRTKVDQAKQNLRKLEEIRYDLSLRERS